MGRFIDYISNAGLPRVIDAARPVNRTLALVVLMLSFCLPASAQSYQQGKLLKWDTEAYAGHGDVTQKAAVYYIQVGIVVYQVTRGSARPEANLVSGRPIRCRIEKENMFVPGG